MAHLNQGVGKDLLVSSLEFIQQAETLCPFFYIKGKPGKV